MGRIRGKRNRDQDRYTHERRKITQAGMVGVAAISEPEQVEALIVRPRSSLGRVDFRAQKQAIRAVVARAIAVRKAPRISKPRQSTSATVVSRPIEARASWHYLFNAEGWPLFDYRDLDPEMTVYRPPYLTTDYSGVFDPRPFSPANEFGRLTFGGRDDGIAKEHIARDKYGGIARCAIDHFGSHQRWQERIGENAPNVKLTESAVVQMRERYAAGGVSMMKLAKEYGVSQGTVNGIVWGSLWIYAPGPVKCRQVMRARCTKSDATYNAYGERSQSEHHPRPEMLTADEKKTLDDVEARRESERYVSRLEAAAWKGTDPIQYENGTFYPSENRFVLDDPSELKRWSKR